MEGGNEIGSVKRGEEVELSRLRRIWTVSVGKVLGNRLF